FCPAFRSRPCVCATFPPPQSWSNTLFPSYSQPPYHARSFLPPLHHKSARIAIRTLFHMSPWRDIQPVGGDCGKAPHPSRLRPLPGTDCRTLSFFLLSRSS